MGDLTYCEGNGTATAHGSPIDLMIFEKKFSSDRSFTPNADRTRRQAASAYHVAVHCPVEMLSSIDTSTKRNSFTIIDKPCPNIQGSFQDSTKISIPAIYCTISALITIASNLQDSLSYLHVRARARCVLGCYTIKQGRSPSIRPPGHP